MENLVKTVSVVRWQSVPSAHADDNMRFTGQIRITFPSFSSPTKGAGAPRRRAFSSVYQRRRVWVLAGLRPM